MSHYRVSCKKGSFELKSLVLQKCVVISSNMEGVGVVLTSVILTRLDCMEFIKIEMDIRLYRPQY